MEIMMANRRIDADVVAEIERLLRLTDLTYREIADITGVCKATVGRVSLGTWATEEAATARLEAAVSLAPLLGKLELRCSGCGSKSRELLGKETCLTCDIRRRQGRGTPEEDISLETDLARQHLARYRAMRTRAKARHEAREKKGKTALANLKRDEEFSGVE